MLGIEAPILRSRPARSLLPAVDESGAVDGLGHQVDVGAEFRAVAVLAAAIAQRSDLVASWCARIGKLDARKLGKLRGIDRRLDGKAGTKEEVETVGEARETGTHTEARYDTVRLARDGKTAAENRDRHDDEKRHPKLTPRLEAAELVEEKHQRAEQEPQIARR